MYYAQLPTSTFIALALLGIVLMCAEIYFYYKKLDAQEKKGYLIETLIAVMIATFLWAVILYYFIRHNVTEVRYIPAWSLAFALITVFGLRSWHTNCRC